MKKIILLTMLGLLFSWGTAAQEKLQIDISKSKIQWIGDYTFFFGDHEGTIDFKEGYFIKTGGKISGGSFVIDMNSIKNTDIEKEDANESLVNHLKDPDFFDVKKYPLAKLVITNVEYHDETHMKIEADMTIKGITSSINFKAEADYGKKQLNTKFKIDRRRWNVNYTSEFKDSAISDAIGFKVKINL